LKVTNSRPENVEIFDEKQPAAVDTIEVRRRVSGQIRFTLQVPELKAATEIMTRFEQVII